MINTKKNIDEFLQQEKIAVVGVSRNKDKFGNMIYRDMKTAGYKVMAVNPNADMVEGDRCYAGLGALPEKPDAVLIVLPSKQGLEIIEEAARMDVRHVWVQQGADSPEIDKRLNELDLVAVSGECVFMFLEPVKSVHAVHRFFRRIFGKMPK
jgi:predicted CoA-binding protein